MSKRKIDETDFADEFHDRYEQNQRQERRDNSDAAKNAPPEVSVNEHVHENENENDDGVDPTFIQLMQRMLSEDAPKRRRHDNGSDHGDDNDEFNNNSNDNRNSDSHGYPGQGQGQGQDNVGADDKRHKENRFFGFVSSGFPKLATMNGEAIAEDLDEKIQLEAILSKCNSTDVKEREEARKIGCKVTNKHVVSEICRVCEFIDPHLYQNNLNGPANQNKSLSKTVRLTDITLCGHINEPQLFHKITDMYNNFRIKNAGMGPVLDLFTTDEVAKCFNNHNKMNLKRVLVKGINTIQTLQKEALNHIHGESSTGQKIYYPNVAKHVVDLVDKEVSLTNKLIQADMLYRGFGVIGTDVQASASSASRNSKPPLKATLGKPGRGVG